MRFDDFIVLKNYVRIADGTFVLGDSLNVRIRAFQPVGGAEVVAEDGSISREFECFAEINKFVDRGAKVWRNGVEYIVSEIEVFDFPEAENKNMKLKLRRKLRAQS